MSFNSINKKIETKNTVFEENEKLTQSKNSSKTEQLYKDLFIQKLKLFVNKKLIIFLFILIFLLFIFGLLLLFLKYFNKLTNFSDIFQGQIERNNKLIDDIKSESKNLKKEIKYIQPMEKNQNTNMYLNNLLKKIEKNNKIIEYIKLELKYIQKKIIKLLKFKDEYEFLDDLINYNISNINIEKSKIIYKRIQNVKKKGINIMNPIYCDEKLNWLATFDNLPIKTKLTDKIQLCDYTIEKLGINLCIPKLKIYDKPEDINFDELPNEFIIKTNHGSGNQFYEIIKNKTLINRAKIINKFKKALKINYSYGLEPHYYSIKPKVYVEALIGDQKAELKDYKISCFNGKPEFILVCSKRGTKNETKNYYYTNFTYFPIHRKHTKTDSNFLDDKPKNFDKMLKYAKILSKDFIYVRVDFYNIEGKIYLGELTFTPANGDWYFDNRNIDKQIGDLFNLRKYPNHVDSYKKKNLIINYPETNIPFSIDNFK